MAPPKLGDIHQETFVDTAPARSVVPPPRTRIHERRADQPLTAQPATGASAAQIGAAGTASGFRFFWPAVCALCVAVVVATAGDYHYRGTALFEVTGPVDECRRQLLDFMWQGQRDGRVSPQWRVTATSQSRVLALSIATRDARQTRNELDTIAEQFEAHLARSAEHPLQEADGAYDVLEQIGAQLRAQVEQSRGNLEQQDNTAFTVTPPQARDRVLAELTAKAQAIEDLRRAERAVQDHVRRMENEIPQPRVDAQTRQSAYRQRTDLQQDIKQQRVQLTLARRQLEQVWQNASPRLDKLIAVTARLARVGLSDQAVSASPAHRRCVNRLAERTEIFRKRLASFAKKWTETFVRMRQEPIDPFAPRVFAAQSRLHELLSDYSYRSGLVLEEMSEQARLLDQQTDDAARNHALVAHVKRTFHRLTAEHRQFEFIASDVSCRNNFRLDSAIKSARGLSRRINHTIAGIDAQLATEARSLAESTRRERIEAARSELQRIRTDCGTIIEQVIALQPRLAETIAASDQFIRTASTTAAAQRQLAVMEQELVRYQSLLEELERKRRASEPRTCDVKVLECSTETIPANLAGQAGKAGMAGLLAFAATAFAGRRFGASHWP
ncbi:MAG: hypothetical protein V3W34_05675 [Phycisphaerae bacterium]